MNDVNRIPHLPPIDRFEIVGFRAVRSVHLSPGDSIVTRLDHHEQVVRLRRLHDEVQVAVLRLPWTDTARRFHEGSSDMTGRYREPEYRIPRSGRYGAAGVNHPELERVALFVRNRSVGVATDHECPLELGVRTGTAP